MCGVRKEAQEEARRGAGRTAAPEGQGEEEGLEESREAGGKGRGKAWVERRQGERREAERQAFQWPRRKISRQNHSCEIRNFRETQGQAARGKPRFDVGGRRLSCAKLVMPRLVPGIHVLSAQQQAGRGWPGHPARRRASAFARP